VRRSVVVVPPSIRLGDRYRMTRDAEVGVTYIYYAPAHTVGGRALLPAGTIIVALDQAEGATWFAGYPERYDELEEVAVPDDERNGQGYAGGYALHFKVSDVGDLLESIEPLNPRPSENRLPRVSRFGPWRD
jgi:hypothetical protein